MDLGLTDRVVLVTGGSSGIGLATVELLAAEGAMVATCARGLPRLQDAVEHLDPARLLAVGCDVRNRLEVDALVEATVDRFGHLDGLVTNAGRGTAGRWEDLSDADWHRELQIKVFGVLNPVRAAVAHLARSDAARVVTVSAVSAREPDPSMIASAPPEPRTPT